MAMTRIRKGALAPAVIAAVWVFVAGLSWWSGRETPLDESAAAPKWVRVVVPAGSPATRDWTHFLACSGLSTDPALMRATLLLNGGGDEAVWRQAGVEDVPVRVALGPLPGELPAAADKIIGDAPRAVADCGDTE